MVATSQTIVGDTFVRVKEKFRFFSVFCHYWGGLPHRRLSEWTMADEVTCVVCHTYVGAHSVIQTMGGEAHLYVV